MDDIVKITLRVPDQKALQDILSLVPGVHLDCGAPRSDGHGQFILVLYGSKAEADTLSAKTAFVSEVDHHYAEVLEERQKEVAVGDRFQGGKIKPQGVGVLK